MKKTKVILSLIVIAGTLLSSCTKDDDSNPEVKAPETYTFDRNSNSTVSFDGQTTRIKMAEEIIAAMLDNTNSKDKLNDMFAHTEGANNFSDANLNNSSKNVRSKTAASRDFFSANTTDAAAIKKEFDSWLDMQVDSIFPNWSKVAVAGSAGQLQEAGGGSTRYINGKGLEYNQAFSKSMIGALMLDQIVNNYLSTSVLDEGTNVEDNNEGVLAEEKPYTNMEHKWDEAYGYLYGTESDPASPTLGADNFLNKYLQKVDNDPDFSGIANTIYEAFKLGRAAIVAKNYELRDKQVDILRENLSKVIAIRAVHYLQSAKSALASDKAAAFHDLSEGYGFIYSLQFTRIPGTSNPYFTKSEVETLINQLMTGNGFWDVSTSTLDQISDEISAKFDFTTLQTAD